MFEKAIGKISKQVGNDPKAKPGNIGRTMEIQWYAWTRPRAQSAGAAEKELPKAWPLGAG